MSCLFNSLSYFLNKKYENIYNNRQISGKNLRNIICDFLEKNPIIFDDMTVFKIIDKGSDEFLSDPVAPSSALFTEGDRFIRHPRSCSCTESNQINIENFKVYKYVQKMRCDNTYGGALEIKAFCRLFNLNVLIKSIPNNRNIEFIENKKNEWIYVSWTGNHFTPIDI